MPVRAIVGAQWGDEGKGKITDLLAQSADLVVRFGGGGNAGHTVIHEGVTFKLHLVPSGIFSPSATSLIGTGTVVDFDLLHEEMRVLGESGVALGTLAISDRAHVVMPYDLLLDRLREEGAGGAAIGTTRRGVGPTYTDKAARVGIQVGDVMQPDVFAAKLDRVLPDKDRELAHFGHPTLSRDRILASAETWRTEFAGCVVDQIDLLHDFLPRTHVILEGQLGAMRDLDWGTYPYVTSSTTIAGGGAVGGGIPPWLITDVLGVVKAYTTAVGAGPFPTELDGDVADHLRDRGGEYGATTGRPRRVGWFDVVAARYACRLNGFSEIAVTKLDVLDGFDTIPICIGYRLDGEEIETVPIGSMLSRVVPIYEEMPGWSGPTSSARTLAELPAEARAYLDRISELVGAPIGIVSVGPRRDETIVVEQPEWDATRA